MFVYNKNYIQSECSQFHIQQYFIDYSNLQRYLVMKNISGKISIQLYERMCTYILYVLVKFVWNVSRLQIFGFDCCKLLGNWLTDMAKKL